MVEPYKNDKEGKRERIKLYLTIFGIVVLVILVVFLNEWVNQSVGISEELAQCLGEKCVLYIGEGCPHCEHQLNMFGVNEGYLEKVDCTKNSIRCGEEGITRVPSWKCWGEIYVGVQNENKLKNMSGC